ncbi:DUF3987 domain-containing protein [Flavobacteriaceae bacterium F89]|uniref:DUF3987 domain-containing protein n=1 Tax=Cerina litoralis TaxID=2874477 RepID=A0AAE3EVG3_9FLAO|nr:DUF3987 domain-containing protein [Cerina litoralis]MCG2460387.1 DUF3987 domain-containing protein [Cerina litoralis]
MENHHNSPYISQSKDRKLNSKINNLSDAIDSAMNKGNNGFPLEVYPEALQNLIRNAQKTVGYNPDYLCAGILSIAATALGNTVNLDNGSYMAKPILWLSIIGRPGTGKTHPLQFAKKPIEGKDNETFIEYKEKFAEYEQTDKDKKGKKPMYSKFILKDFTPEKLAESLQFNEKGVLIFQDELMRWINSFDQYKKGGDQQMYLDLFNGSGLTVDRVTKEPIRIEQTNVNILGGMQPDVLKGLANNDRSQDGFLDRFLFVFPDNLKPILFTGLKIEAVHQENYKRLIGNLLDAPMQTIKATASTIKVYKEWQHHNARESYKDHLETAIQAKMETYVWRLALILEMMHQATTGRYNTTLQDKSSRDAIKLVEYFRSNTLKVHDRLMTKNPLENLTAMQLDVYDSLPDEFKRIDVLPLFQQKGMPERTGDRFLNNGQLFYNYKTHKELKQGQYKKKIS